MDEDTTTIRVRRILLDGAREAYAPDTAPRAGIPVDRRCPGCGVDRDGCDHPFCSRYLSESEE